MLLKMLTFYLTMYFVVLNCFIKLTLFYKTQLISCLNPLHIGWLFMLY